MTHIDNMTVGSGRLLKEDDTVANIADLLETIAAGGSSEVTLAEGTEVTLAEGTEVTLAEGTEVDLANGAEVALIANTKVGLVGNTLAEQKTQADAVENVITFSENIEVIEIFHAEETWQRFIVNGLTLVIPSGGYRTPIAGVPAATITIPAAVNCIVGRLV